MDQPTLRRGRSRGAGAYKQIGLAKKITVSGRRPAPASVEETSRLPSLLKVKPMRLSKSKLMELSERDRTRDASLMKDKLSQQQEVDLRMLQEQINASEDMEAMYNNMDNDWVDDDEETQCDGEAAQEREVIEELGVPIGDTEWASRLSTEDKAWRGKLKELCDAYLEYCSSQEEGPAKNSDLEGATAASDTTQKRTISLECVSLKEQKNITFAFDSESCVQPLLSQGYLSSTPTRPTMAFSLDILELADALQWRSPSTSIQGIAHALCDLRNVPYKHYHRVQLSSALDVYRMICHEAKSRLDKILTHDSHGRKPENCCAQCMYRLKNEPQLQYAMLVTGDGNNSLKRCSRAATADKWQYKSEYYINQSEVDTFKNEVASSQKNQESSTSSEKTDCERRWKNASADKQAEKFSKNFFHETGIFTSTCRHSFVLTV
ncbi:hypothetical protein FRC11_008489 [Ceratobasidium sp. 423]|nr:hypothetical protein FRC11_008489 [Ceratobasidium sp. 423]